MICSSEFRIVQFHICLTDIWEYTEMRNMDGAAVTKEVQLAANPHANRMSSG